MSMTARRKKAEVPQPKEEDYSQYILPSGPATCWIGKQIYLIILYFGGEHRVQTFTNPLGNELEKFVVNILARCDYSVLKQKLLPFEFT
jgi:hypothetical protein